MAVRCESRGELRLMVVHEAVVDDDNETPAQSQRLEDGSGAGVRDDERGGLHVCAQRRLEAIPLEYHTRLGRRCGGGNGCITAPADLQDEAGDAGAAQSGDGGRRSGVADKFVEFGGADGDKGGAHGRACSPRRPGEGEMSDEEEGNLDDDDDIDDDEGDDGVMDGRRHGWSDEDKRMLTRVLME
jgi:hypothetical protein